MWRDSKKADIYKPRKKTSEETKPSNILILDFWIQALWESGFLLFKPPSLWYFVMADLSNKYTRLSTCVYIWNENSLYQKTIF